MDGLGSEVLLAVCSTVLKDEMGDQERFKAQILLPEPKFWDHRHWEPQKGY